MEVIVGGTFGYLHKGHKALLSKAFEIGDHVCIGLTTDAYVNRMKSAEKIPGYSERRRELVQFISGLGKAFEILPLEDNFGPAPTGKFDAIVVSPETKQNAMKINEMRKENCLSPLSIVVVDYVLAYDSRPISTSRISAGEIDREGNRAAVGSHSKSRC
jgi:pantetheine-phosphate adenylyltransferase